MTSKFVHHEFAISSSGLLSKFNIHCKIERPKKQLHKMRNYGTKELKTLRVMIKDPRLTGCNRA